MLNIHEACNHILQHTYLLKLLAFSLHITCFNHSRFYNSNTTYKYLP